MRGRLCSFSLGAREPVLETDARGLPGTSNCCPLTTRPPPHPADLSRQRACPPVSWLLAGWGDRGWFPRSRPNRSRSEVSGVPCRPSARGSAADTGAPARAGEAVGQSAHLGAASARSTARPPVISTSAAVRAGSAAGRRRRGNGRGTPASKAAPFAAGLKGVAGSALRMREVFSTGGTAGQPVRTLSTIGLAACSTTPTEAAILPRLVDRLS